MIAFRMWKTKTPKGIRTEVKIYHGWFLFWILPLYIKHVDTILS